MKPQYQPKQPHVPSDLQIAYSKTPVRERRHINLEVEKFSDIKGIGEFGALEILARVGQFLNARDEDVHD